MVKKIAINHLRKGMYVCGTDRKWIDIPFFLSKFLVKSDKQIDTLHEYCQFVYIDTAKGLDVAEPREIGDGEPSATEAAGEPGSENSSTTTVYRQSQLRLSELFNDARHGKPLALANIDSIAAALLDNIIADEQALLDLAQSSQPSADMLAHKSVNVAILAIAIGRFLGLAHEQLRLLGQGALLHDVGLLRVSDDILAKAEALAPQERAEIEKHVDYGLALLAEMPDLSSEVAAIVAGHHQRLDGSGNPCGLAGEAPGDWVRIVAIASVYEALIGRRVYHPAVPPATALAFLYGSEPLCFDAGLVADFIKMLGIYPVGCFVELASGELAIVVKDNLQHPSRPLLNIVTDAHKQLLFEEQLLELLEGSQQTIVNVLASDEPIIELLQTFTSLEKIQ